MRRHRQEIERFQRRHHLARIGIGHRDIDTGDVHRAHRVGLTGQDGVERRRVVHRGLPAFRASPQREPAGAESLVRSVRRQCKFRIVQNVDVIAETTGAFHPDIATRAIDIPRYRDKAVKGPEGLHAIGKGVDPMARHETGRPVRIKPRCRDNIVRGYAAQVRGAGGCIRGGTFRQFGKAAGPAFDEIPIVEVFLDDHVDHRQRDGRITTGFRAEPDIRRFGRRCLRGVDDDEFRSFFLGTFETHPLNRVRR